jgi:energy-coupling factor transporter transmembrane protein EcfT
LLFSVKIDSPLARLHVVTKLLAVLALSLVAVRAMRTASPDPVTLLLIWLLALLGLALGGAIRWLFRSYLLVLLPALLVMTFTWIAFNPAPEGEALLRIPVYNGRLSIGLSLGLGVFLACAAGWYALSKELFGGLVVGLLVAFVVTRIWGNPRLSFFEFPFFHPMAIAVSRVSLAVALTKGLGYGAMILISLLLMMTSRDIEITGAMQQFGLPYVASFFVSTMLRSLSMALSDYRTIRQAQIARGAALEKKNPIGVLSDLAWTAIPLTATMLRRASEVGEAALLRGLTTETSHPTEFHEIQPLRRPDWIVLALCTLWAVASFGLKLDLTRLLGQTW